MSHHMQGNTHRIIVLSGPTAVGKGTLEHKVRSEHPEIWLSISATTRKPRVHEVHGQDYWFMSDEEFSRARGRHEFLETALVHGTYWYGTPLQPVIDHVNQGIPTLLEIDIQGARRVKKRAQELGVDVLYVFIAPPTFEDLVIRLSSRATEDKQEQERRLQTAKEELAAQDEFDIVIVNDDVERASQELWNVIRQEYSA